MKFIFPALFFLFLFSCTNSPENKIKSDSSPSKDSLLIQNKSDSFTWTRMNRNDTMESCGCSFTENDSDLAHEKKFVCHTFIEYGFAIVSVNGEIIKLKLMHSDELPGKGIMFEKLDETYSDGKYTLEIHIHYTIGQAPKEDSDEEEFYSGTAILKNSHQSKEVKITGTCGC